MSNNDLPCRDCGTQHHPMDVCPGKGEPLTDKLRRTIVQQEEIIEALRAKNEELRKQLEKEAARAHQRKREKDSAKKEVEKLRQQLRAKLKQRNTN
jgi:SMC interacting uncharacterized protein involved in chromosome segregation